MRRHHHGSGRLAVIPKDWSAAHRPVAEGRFTATCQIRKPGGTTGDFDPATGTRPTTPYAAHYTGPCSVQVLPALEQEAVTGTQEITTVGYRVSIAHDVASALAVDDLVKITTVDDNGDATLVERTLKVRSFTRGSLAWERDLICSDSLG